jgi:hypothetical protein
LRLKALELDCDLRHYMWACAAAGWSYAQRGRWQEAVAQCEEGLRAGDEYHDDSVTCFSALILANARADQGAMGLALEAAELSAKAQTPADEIWAQSFLSPGLVSDGPPAGGRDGSSKRVGPSGLWPSGLSRAGCASFRLGPPLTRRGRPPSPSRT